MAFGFLAQLPHCSANSLQFPAHAKISLLGRKKFPAPMRREFRRNWSGLLLNPTAPAAKKGENCEIPCRIPCSQGIWRQESNGACCADSVRPETALIQGWKPVFRKDHATENRYPLFLKML